MEPTPISSPEHTETARSIMGPDAWLCVEQKVVLEEDPSKARDLARKAAAMYQTLPNYRNNWLRMGLSEEDISQSSDKFIDTTFAWGKVEQIKSRIQEPSTGASHVCIQPINPNGDVVYIGSASNNYQTSKSVNLLNEFDVLARACSEP